MGWRVFGKCMGLRVVGECMEWTDIMRAGPITVRETCRPSDTKGNPHRRPDRCRRRGDAGVRDQYRPRRWSLLRRPESDTSGH